jgi:hypothetical protein
MRPDSRILLSLQASCARFLAVPDEVTDVYLAAVEAVTPQGHVLRAAPELATDLRDLMLDAVVHSSDPDRTEAECQDFGGRCALAGVPDDTYDYAGRAVARTAREVVDDVWTSTVGSAWVAVHLWVVSHLEAGAAEARRGNADPA